MAKTVKFIKTEIMVVAGSEKEGGMGTFYLMGMEV